MLLLYLITNNHSHVSGLYYLPNVTTSHETGIDIAKLDTLFDTLSRPKPSQDSVGFIRRDTKNELVWVVNMLGYQGRGEKILRATANHFRTLHNSELINDFLQKYPSVKRYYRHRVSDTPSRPRTEKDQVGIQEQEQDKSITPPGGDVPPLNESESLEADTPPKFRKEASGPHHELIRHFRAGWEANYGAEYAWAGKDLKATQRILDAVHRDGEEAKSLVNKFLADDDPFVADKHHPLPLLLSQINRYRGARKHSGRNGAVAVREDN